MTTEKESMWEPELGLPNDVDGYMSNCRFGTRDEYIQQIIASGAEGEGTMLLFDMVDENGEAMGQQGYSVGSGWTVSDDGTTITHLTRKNVVISSRYGQLQHRVVKELGVNMGLYGKPTYAPSWNGLGFHWMLEAHETLKKLEDGSREKKQGLMPTSFIGVSEAIRGGKIEVPATETRGPRVDPGLEAKLADLAQTNSFKAFVLAALRIEAVSRDDTLMASVMDDGKEGFFQTHQS